MGEQKTTASSVNRAKTYQLVLFPLNNGATNVYYVLVLSYIATFGSKVLALSMLFASVMVTGMRLFDAITDPIIGALMDRTNGKFGKFRPFMVIGNLIMAASILVLYCLTPLIPASAMGLRYAAFVGLYAVWVIGYTFQTSCTRSGQTVLTNDPKQRPLFTIFNTVGSLLGMGAMQFFAPILAKNYEGGYASAGFFRTLAPVGIVISILLTLLAVIGIWEKDQPKYFGIGGEKTEKLKVSEYVQIIKENKPMQRLMVAGAGCKLALSIATRCDCLPPEVLDLLAELNTIKPVWVELGLQTIHEHTLHLIRSGFSLAQYEQAVSALHARGIKVITHLILGLPGETTEDMRASVRYLAAHPVFGVKLQLLHVLEGTDLGTLYKNDPFPLFTLEEYCDLIADCLALLPPEMVIHRLTGDGPRRLLLAPLWSTDKKRVLNTINRQLIQRDLWQGKYYRNEETHG